MDRTNASGSIDGAYVDDDPVNEITGTLLVAHDRNAIQEELLAVIEAAGITPNGNNWAQILAALRSSAANLVDANKLNGQLAEFYRDAGNLNAGTVPEARLPLAAIAAAINYTAADVLLKLLTVDGAESGLVSEDSTKLGGVAAANFIHGNENGAILANSGSFSSNATRSGFYIFNGITVSDLPDAEFYSGYITKYDNNTGNAEIVATSGKKYARSLGGGVWSSWILISDNGVAPNSADSKMLNSAAKAFKFQLYNAGNTLLKRICILPNGTNSTDSARINLSLHDWTFMYGTGEFVFKNRNGFKYIAHHDGSVSVSTCGIACYNRSDGGIDVCIYAHAGQFIEASVLVDGEDIIFSNGEDFVPSGSLCFDSADTTTYPINRKTWNSNSHPTTLTGYGITDALKDSVIVTGTARTIYNQGIVSYTRREFISFVRGSLKLDFVHDNLAGLITVTSAGKTVYQYNHPDNTAINITVDVPVYHSQPVVLTCSAGNITRFMVKDDGTCSGALYDETVAFLNLG